MIKDIFLVEDGIIVNKITIDDTFNLSEVQYIEESSGLILDIGYVYDEELQTFVPPSGPLEPTLDELLGLVNGDSAVNNGQLNEQLEAIISEL